MPTASTSTIGPPILGFLGMTHVLDREADEGETADRLEQLADLFGGHHVVVGDAAPREQVVQPPPVLLDKGSEVQQRGRERQPA